MHRDDRPGATGLEDAPHVEGAAIEDAPLPAGVAIEDAPLSAGAAIEDAPALQSVADETISRAVEFLTGNLYDPGLASSAIARHVGLDPWQFCRRFRAVTGMTCSEFITGRRMAEARRLLKMEDLLIKEIAYRLGFGDPNYFSRRFKRVVGISPTAYRRLSPGRR